MKPDISKLTEKAIKNLSFKRHYYYNKKLFVIASLIRNEDSRPLDASWWHGKQVSIIGSDINGNFFLRHCDGTVRLWNHKEQKDIIISPSVRDFIEGIEDSY